MWIRCRNFVSVGLSIGLCLALAQVSVSAQGGPPSGSGLVGELEAEIDALMVRVDALESALAAAEARLDGDIAQNVGDIAQNVGDIAQNTADVGGGDLRLDGLEALLAGVTRVTPLETNVDTLLLSGMNLQVTNGQNPPYLPTQMNGAGNIIIGYNQFTDPTKFGHLTNNPFNGSVSWAPGKTGSHNLVVGEKHTYTRVAGIVSGLENVLSGGSAVAFGIRNVVTNNFGVITGGVLNATTGDGGSVSGGLLNWAEGEFSVVSGGVSNHARLGDNNSTVSGGANQTTTGANSHVP